MLLLKTIILTILVGLIGYTLDMTSPKEEAFLYGQLEKLLFAEDLGDEAIDGFYRVVRVVDGDTIVVSIDGEEQKIRLLGIDTPETVDPRREVECFGKEASNKTKDFLKFGRVRFESDLSQGDTDNYGRLLRYVFLADGTHVNLELIRLGYAHEYTYNLPYRYQTDFKQAEQEAREAGRGLWGDICENM